ncbi:MAG: hypothetical protein [Microvirus sp.]|nr:MAG: hypothetical protein [Microvirus sp.]
MHDIERLYNERAKVMEFIKKWHGKRKRAENALEKYTSQLIRLNTRLERLKPPSD